MIQLGDSIPKQAITVIDKDGQHDIKANEYFANKKVVLFALPGAFTPTCSEAHLPGYVVNYDNLVNKGIDVVACLSVNDAFVMKAWQDQQNAENIAMIADGGASLTNAMGLAMNTGDFGGVRSQRYSMLIDNNTVTQLNIEAPSSFEVSDVETMLTQL
ncbi:MAG: peroxiredoxin [Gammaproteobacteria bacterium]|nr:peroxiredoxin [Gammaproteobacteria bacterium]